MCQPCRIIFVDDTLIFGRVTTTKLVKIREILRKYEAASGQAINLAKSDIMFSTGIAEQRGECFANILGGTKSGAA